MAEPIKIIITQGGSDDAGLNSSFLRGTDSGDIIPKGRTTNFGKESSLLFEKDKTVEMALAAAALSAGKKMILNSIDNYANTTGNYIQQTHINDAIDLTTHIAGLTIASYAAYATLGPYSIIPIALAETVNISQKIKAYDINVSKQNYQAQRMRERAGMSLGNNSRGTEN